MMLNKNKVKKIISAAKPSKRFDEFDTNIK